MNELTDWLPMLLVAIIRMDISTGGQECRDTVSVATFRSPRQSPVIRRMDISTGGQERRNTLGVPTLRISTGGQELLDTLGVPIMCGTQQRLVLSSLVHHTLRQQHSRPIHIPHCAHTLHRRLDHRVARVPGTRCQPAVPHRTQRPGVGIKYCPSAYSTRTRV